MLTDKQMDAALGVFQARMQAVTDEYFRRMGEHIRDIGQLAPSDVHRLQQMRRLNRNLADVERQLARAAGMTVKDLETVLTAAAETDDRVTRKILGVKDIDVSLANNAPLRRALRAQYAETAGRLSNLSNTTVAAQAYRRAVDSAVTAVQSGAEDYESAIRRQLRQAGAMGLRVRDDGTTAVEYESGHTRRVDTAVRMNVLDAMRRMNQRAMEEVGREFGADGVEIDAHMLCAEDHLPYQGLQFTNDEFDEIQAGLVRPFGEWNCRHTWHPIIMGVSPRAYTEEELDRFARYSTEEVEIDGRVKTRYEWSQEMRRMETAIREKKDTATLAAAAGDEQLRRECQGSVNAMVKGYERLSDMTGLGPDFRRTYVAGFKDVAASSEQAIGAADAKRNTYSSVYFDEKASYRIRLNDFSREVNEGLSQAIRDVAIKGTDTGYEHMYLVNLKSGRLDFYETNESPNMVGFSFRKHLKDHPGERYAFVHNHNTDGFLSSVDLTTMASTEQIPVMIAARNDGVIYVAQRKAGALMNQDFILRYPDEVEALRKDIRSGIITPVEYSKRLEFLTIDIVQRDYVKGGHAVEFDTRN